MPVERLNYGLRQLYLAELQRKLLPDRDWDAEAVHRSDLIFCLRKAFFRYQLVAERHSEQLLMLFLRGRVLHEMLAVGQAEVEYLAEGIVMHADDLVDGQLVEKKTTNMKFAEPPKLSAHWYLELAYAASHSPERRANLMLLHLNGDYRQRTPMLNGPWEYTFSQAELEAVTGWFSERRRVLVEAMAEGQPPAVRYRMAWECKECPFVGRCAQELLAPDATPVAMPFGEEVQSE